MDQLHNLSKRSTFRSDRKNWNAIYNIIFPNDPLLTCPYLEASVSKEVNHVGEAVLAAAPVALRNALWQVPKEFRESYAAEIEERVSLVDVQVFERILDGM